MKQFTLPCLLCCLLGCDKPTKPTVVYIPPAVVPSVAAGLTIVAGDGLLGSGDYGESRQCTFVIRHQLPDSIRLQVVEKSCTCAGVKLTDQLIAPGKETTVTLSWVPKVEPIDTTQVRLWADLADDTGKHRLRLEATGTLEPKVQFAFPRGPLDWGKFSVAELTQPSLERVVEVFSKTESLPQPAITFSQPGMKMTTIERLAPDRLAALNAKFGYRITVKPLGNLAHGPLAMDMLVKFPSRNLPIKLLLAGQLESSAVSVNVDKIVLPPRLSLQAGYKVPQVILTPRFGTVSHCEVVSVQPPVFDAKVTKVENAWRLDLYLIKNAGQLQQAMSPEQWQSITEQGFETGSITLKLDHPDVKTLTIPMGGSLVVR
jgi:hypothetical protein